MHPQVVPSLGALSKRDKCLRPLFLTFYGPLCGAREASKIPIESETVVRGVVVHTQTRRT